MRIADYIPADHLGKDTWMRNFAGKLPQYSAKYAIPAEDVTLVQQNALAFNYWLNYKNQAEEFVQKLTAYMRELIIGSDSDEMSITPVFPDLGPPPSGYSNAIFLHARSIASIIKKNRKFTSSDGKDLGIVAPTHAAADPQTMKPEIKLRLVNGGKPEVVWRKKGMDRIELHVNRGEGFKFLAYDTYPNYTDSFELGKGTAAIWSYRAVYIKKDTRVGEWSNEVSITVSRA